MTFKSSTQPLCRACGKPIAKLTETHWICAANPRQTGSIAQHPLYHYIADGEPWPTNAEATQALSNLKVVSIRRDSYRKDEPELAKRVGMFTVWDGESYDDEFFCTGTCAQSFGRMAAQSGGIKSVAYSDAIRRQKGEKVA